MLMRSLGTFARLASTTRPAARSSGALRGISTGRSGARSTRPWLYAGAVVGTVATSLLATKYITDSHRGKRLHAQAIADKWRKAAGSGRAGPADAVRNEEPPIPALPSPAAPAFDSDKTVVIFVLGGPGVGKGTQCTNLVRDYGFVHLSAGDLLRAEQKREGSQYGELIKSYIREGKIVPMEVTIALLENAMKEAHGCTRFLVDGFPRKLDQAIKFEEVVCKSKFVIYFECTEATMLKRLLKRSETSGRDDDNVESIKKRFRTFVETSMPVVEYFRKQDKVLTVNCEKSIDGVYAELRQAVEKAL